MFTETKQKIRGGKMLNFLNIVFFFVNFSIDLLYILYNTRLISVIVNRAVVKKKKAEKSETHQYH